MANLSCTDLQSISDQVFPPMVQALGLRVERAKGDEVVVRMPVSRHAARPDGVISGQAICTLADTAMVLAIASQLGEFRPVSTVDLHVSFLGAIRGADAIAMAKVERIGSSLAFVSMVVTSVNDSRKLAAKASATFAMPRESSGQEMTP
ncbi:PaaI family thioesterase [Paraburkholderia sp. 40]|uniref:PaaI family thioesterase n=1 Tax=Paraburkholderia sp. 40 TaxID=2991059 RepID=UPI003D211706